MTTTLNPDGYTTTDLNDYIEFLLNKGYDWDNVISMSEEEVINACDNEYINMSK